MMISFGVEMTSYLQVPKVSYKEEDRIVGHVQFYDVRVPECPHVLDFSLHSGFSLRRRDDLFRDKFHCNSMTCDSMNSHWNKSQSYVDNRR